MTTQVTRGNGTIQIGPPGGPTYPIPTEFFISIHTDPTYDLELDIAWDVEGGRHAVHRLIATARPGSDYVRMSQLSRITLADRVTAALEADVIGDQWAAIVAAHPEDDPVAVDALVYLLSHALGGRKPSATVALARGLSPATGPKHVSRARDRGLLPPAAPGKATAASVG